MSQSEDRPPILRLTWSLVGTFLFAELLFTAVVIGATILLCVRHDGRASEPDSAERAVRELLARQVEDWNKGDLDRFMDGYWKDDRLTFYSGATVTKGWQATLDRYRKRYKSEGKEMGTLVFSELSVEPFDAGHAVARGRWRLTLKDGTTPNGLFTLIFRRIDGQWRIVHDHTSAAEKTS
jgi:beta-aspartyl-peptidase (threonine type)